MFSWVKMEMGEEGGEGGEKLDGWSVFPAFQIFFSLFPAFQQSEIPPLSECGEFTPTGWLSLCPKKCPTPQPAPNDVFYSRLFNNLGSDYFLLLQLICWLRAAKDDEVKLSAARLKGMGFSLLGPFWMSREERKIDGL